MSSPTRGDPEQTSELYRHVLARSAVLLLVMGVVGIAVTVVPVEPSWGSPVIGTSLLAVDSCALWALIPAWLLLKTGPGGSYRRTAIVVARLAAAVLVLDVGLYIWALFFVFE